MSTFDDEKTRFSEAVQVQIGRKESKEEVKEAVKEELKDELKEEKKQTENKWDEKPLYFMQITAVSQEDFNIQLNVDTVDSNQRKIFFVKESRNDEQNTIKNIKIMVTRNSNSGTQNVDIEEDHDSMYNLSIFDSANKDIPLPKSNDIKLVVLKDKNEFPPSNANYKPNSIDLSTVLKVKDEEKNEIYIYWSIPPRSYGEITYKIVNDVEPASSEIIEKLPYCIPLSNIPTTFRVITIATTEDEEKYESLPSLPISLRSDTIALQKRITTPPKPTNVQQRPQIGSNKSETAITVSYLNYTKTANTKTLIILFQLFSMTLYSMWSRITFYAY